MTERQFEELRKLLFWIWFTNAVSFELVIYLLVRYRL